VSFTLCQFPNQIVAGLVYWLVGIKDERGSLDGKVNSTQCITFYRIYSMTKSCISQQVQFIIEFGVGQTDEIFVIHRKSITSSNPFLLLL
jgi:hypothetical protein